eukprot:3027369-Lingulodinium_polyedra.AAC.2
MREGDGDGGNGDGRGDGKKKSMGAGESGGGNLTKPRPRGAPAGQQGRAVAPAWVLPGPAELLRGSQDARMTPTPNRPPSKNPPTDSCKR